MCALICVMPYVCFDMSALMCSHMPAPMCSHLCVIIIIIIIIIITIIIITITTTSIVSFCPPTLFGVPCQDNFWQFALC